MKPSYFDKHLLAPWDHSGSYFLDFYKSMLIGKKQWLTTHKEEIGNIDLKYALFKDWIPLIS